MKQFLLSALSAFVCLAAQAAEPFISFTHVDDAVPLQQGTIRYSEQDYDAVKIAIGSLKADLQKTIGHEADILVGTIGRNKDIDQLKLSGLKGCREKFIITTVGQEVVIAGSDRRGTVYGIYELSRQLGVSPWYWWADAPIVRHEQAFVKRGTFTDGEPAVEFRGLFLNDEAPCLTTWVKNTWGTNYGDHRFYERVFELILRLKGNFLWPAMWGWAFYADDPENGKTADRMGVIMGTSHHEPMARNHQEYARHRREWGAWNYSTNQAKLDQFFREGIERMKGTEDIVTIGMRGDGDEAMSDKADTKLMERIVANQRRIIKEVTGKPAQKTTQVWALYKEVQDYYDAGFRVPDDVIMLVCDDNWGNIRRVPVNDEERRHKGGWGIYYHVDYVGAPRNTKWLNVTQTQQMFEQLSLAYDHGIQRLWILNVGDLKPMEYPIQLFMDMAWNPKEYTQQTVTDHTLRFFRSVYSDGIAVEAADIYNRNCQYMARVTPEMLDANTYNVETGEWRQVADDYQRLELRALRLYDQIPAETRDFYRQLVLFPVQAMANLYDMYYAQAMNQYLAKQGNPDANTWAGRVAQCFQRDSLLCAAYNHDIAGGKWNGMMIQKHIGYRSWNDDFRADTMPRTTLVDASGRTGGYTFTPSNGYIAIEAEHYYSSTTADGTQWSVYPDYGRTRSAVALTPYTQPVGNSSLTYRFTLPEGTNKVNVHVVVKSTLDFLNVGGYEYTVSLDGCEPQVVNFNKTLVDRQPYMYSEFYPTIARRVVEKTVELPVGTSGTHELTLQPRHPGIVFEKIVVDFGGYRPQYLFGSESPLAAQKSIVILYENDVHCGIDGYTKIAGLRDAINRSDTAYAAAVCVGDFLQGNTTGAISKGGYIADIMQLMDYHALTLGNHEFDYGVPRMKQLLEQVGTPVVCANLYEAGEPNPLFAPYVIRQYGDKRVAYVGATTPETMILEGYSFYDSNGILLYDLKPKTFYQLIQKAVDAARAEGADYVVLLSHVGETPQSMGFSSHRIVNNTRGIDIVLDGHSHEIIESAKATNLDGKEITVTQTGTQFANVGKLLITPDGRFFTQLIKTKEIPYRNAKINATTDSIRQKVKEVTATVVGHSDYKLVVSNENNQMIVRGQETNAGDLVTDAYRYTMKADIGLENGGGIRNDIAAGDITYGDIIGMLPYDNTLRRISVSAQLLKQMLTRCTALVPVLDGNFPQCAGMRFTIHSKSHTVSDIQIQQADGSYAPIDMQRTYTVALTDYNHEGGGFFDCFKKCPVLQESSVRYNEALSDYIGKVLKGNTGKTYAQPQGRITIIED